MQDTIYERYIQEGLLRFSGYCPISITSLNFRHSDASGNLDERVKPIPLDSGLRRKDGFLENLLSDCVAHGTVVPQTEGGRYNGKNQTPPEKAFCRQGSYPMG